jgi:superfamily II DNA or RNA helicase
MHISTARVWARPLTVEQNTVRQLLVEAGTLDIAESEEVLTVANKYGVWPANRNATPSDDGPLTAIIPLVHAAGSRVHWEGNRDLVPPSTVIESYYGTIGFRDATEPHSLRRPQIGALHSVIGYWTSAQPDPGIVVMPTGTGKTETMLALFVATRPERLLVIVPTSVLRDQIATKFETLGILQREQIVASSALRPCVGKLEHGLKKTTSATQLAAAVNVLVATPHAINACSPDARDALLAAFSHLMVDEAHHAPAPSWSALIEVFADRPVLLFTATPFREDGKAIPGRTIYRFPLREAQKDGYFTTIDYKTVASLDNTDTVLADLAITRLRNDLTTGYDPIPLS